MATSIKQVPLTQASSGDSFTLTETTFISVIDDTLGAQVFYERDGARVESHIVTESGTTIGGTSVAQGGADTPGTAPCMFPVTLEDGSVEWINNFRIKHKEEFVSGTINTKIEYDAYGAQLNYILVQETVAELDTTIASRN